MRHGGIYEEEIAGKAYDTALLLRFARYVAPYRLSVAIVILILPLVAACRLAQPWIIKLAIDNHIIPGKLDGLETVALGFLGILLAESLLSFLEVYLLQSVGQRVMSDMRSELYRHVMHLPVTWFDHVPTGSAVTRLTSDIEVLGEMFASGIITIIGDILLLIGIISVMLWMNLKLSLVTFSVLPVLLYVAYTFRRRMRQSFREVRARLGSLNAFLNECIAGISIIQIFNRERDEERRFSELNASYRDANTPVIFWDASLYAMVEALSSIAVALIIWYGGGELVKGALTFGVLVAFIQYIEKFFTPIRDLSAKYSVMQGAMAALERIFALLDTTSTPPPLHHREEQIPSSGGKTAEIGERSAPLIEFRDVSFSYQEGNDILSGFNLAVHRGERIAIVGESGGGKTTITRLLTRLYEIERGCILLQGKDIRELELTEVRRRVGVVLQDPCLFAGSIEFNICLGDEQARQRVRQAAAAVGADRFIERLPNGYQEEVRERGSNFSVGEKQLISFARAVAFEPEILILDEATASIDSASEQMIQEGIKGMMVGRTSLVIAHRLSTIRDADRIVTIHHGIKVEEGTHEELLRAAGIYSKLHQLQFGEM
ncbi:MAG: ABC transporter ATP-binding protein [Desulfuromonadaceae bacterium]|nr:ABC transporter ATP-binding protein [Desulfuromonadaceae bacterium]MDD2847464.1 ABC transporter ATP-binding protein [Desulfuromonadaceae bacterium]MDD4131423.1 ABC transporter ATP-binding protein [Desulfuromonadaceae bacterium]